jgi:ABC-type multidrug transport system permease subunit
MARFDSLWQLYVTRLREFYRQPSRIFWVYAFPTILAVVLGLAFQSRPPEAIHVTVVAGEGSEVVQSALGSDEARAGRPGRPGLAIEVRPEAEARQRLRTGQTPLVIEPGTGGGVTYRYDATRPDAVAARAAVDDVLQRAKGRIDPIRVEDALVTEKGARYIDFLIPGLLGLNTMGGGMWGIGFLIVNFRVNKLLKRFDATPMPRWHFLAALIGARLTFLVPDAAILLGLGHFGFGMPIRGSLALFALVEVAGALAFAGLGLLIASRARNTETVSGLMNLVMLPMWLFSGVFFASDRFPAAFQPLVQALPLTHVIAALRKVLLEGAGIEAIAVSLAVLGGWTVVCFLVALKIFRWS